MERSFPWFFSDSKSGNTRRGRRGFQNPSKNFFSGQVRREALIEINQEPVFVFLGGSECTEWPFLNSSTLTRLRSNTAPSSFGHCVFKVPEDPTYYSAADKSMARCFSLAFYFRSQIPDPRGRPSKHLRNTSRLFFCGEKHQFSAGRVE